MIFFSHIYINKLFISRRQLSKFGSSITLQWEHAISNDSEVQDLLENLEAESSEGEYVPEGEEEEEAVRYLKKLPL